MEISARVRILGAIQPGSVFYFEEETISSPEPHFFVVLNKNPRTEEVLILVCASSQVDKRKQAIKRLGFPPETLVFVSPTEYVLFKKDTVIDCNRAYEKAPQSLIEKLEQGKLKVCTEVMDGAIVEKLLTGVLASTQVVERVKQMLAASVSLELCRKYLGKEVEVVIDRPLGSKHPKHGFEYEANYGFIEGVKAPDGEDLDAYYLGVNEPLKRATGVCIAIAHRKNNDDDKLIVVPQGTEMTDEEIMAAVHFQEQWFDTSIVR